MANSPPGSKPKPALSVTPFEIWTMLRNNGFTFNESAGIMGNMFSESSLNPEAKQQGVTDPGYGLVQWEASSYPSAPSLVTGNPIQDAQAQVVFLAQTGGKQAASGSTPAEAATNFAINYERCAECTPGGAQTEIRAAQATEIAGWANSDQWPTSLGGAAGAVLGAQQAASTASCLYRIPEVDLHVTSVGGWCLISRSEARAVMGALMLTAGTGVMALGAIILVAAGFAKSGVAQKAADAAAVVPGGQGVAAGLSAVHAASTRTGSQARAQRGSQRHARAAQEERQGRERAAREEHEGRQFDEATSRKRDSRKGAAVRDDEDAAPPF